MLEFIKTKKHSKKEMDRFFLACDDLKRAMDKLNKRNSNYISGKDNTKVGDNNVILGQKDKANGNMKSIVGGYGKIDAHNKVY